MYDITRLNELNAAMVRRLETMGDDDILVDEIKTAWPAVAARLALLEEFAQRVSESEYLYDEQATLHSLSAAVSWLEVATEKAGE